MLIRALTPEDDLTEIGRVYAESWQHSYRGIVPDDYLDRLTPERCSAAVRIDPAASLVLYEDGRPVGTCMATFARDAERRGFGEIVSLYLRPGYTGRGRGRQLLEQALQKLRNDGCEDVCLWVLRDNTAAQRFYRRAGFAFSGSTKQELFGAQRVDVVEMIRKL